MDSLRWLAIPASAIIAVPAAFAAQYLTIEQAQQQMFSASARLELLTLQLTPEQTRRLDGIASVSSRVEPRIWKVVVEGALAGYFFLHEVIGKQEYITYAVALDADGKVTGVEILAYRESHGYEIRNPRWRAQFAGKSARDTVRLDADIANISGATLSCRHVTDGVRRILAIYDLTLNKRP
jgi:Na+-translocating ferredoxin:NAD+ oxidoreductase RnfG subunit